MLREIKRLRGAGLSFTKIREHLRNQIPEEWIIYRLNPGLEIHFSRDVHERFLQKQNVSHIMKLVSEFFPEE